MIRRDRVGLQGEVDQVEPEPGLADQVGAVLDVDRRLGIDLGLGLLRPGGGLCQPLLQLADAGEILVELFAVASAQVTLHLPGLIADRVEDALAVGQPPGLGLHLVGAAFQKQLGEHVRRPILRRHGRTALGPGKAGPFARQRERGETRLAVNMIGRELVERDGVLEARPPFRMRGRGQKAQVGIVAGADVGMRQPGDDREVVAKVFQDLQVGRQLVIAARFFRKEKRRMQAQRRVDANHAARNSARRGGADASGRSASRSGSAIATPAARRKVRR